MQPLDDVKVLSLGQIYNGPYCALVLSFLGADVIKVEPPEGETLRERDETSNTPETLMLNSSKRSVTLDLKAPEGKRIFKELVAEADVLVENYGVGTMEGLGLGYDTLSEHTPGLIYAHGSGYGESGEYVEYPAMDLTIQAMTGVMDTTGFPDGPPVKAGVQVADFMGGIHLSAGVLAALYQRQRTGEGQFVEVAMMDAVYPTLLSPMAAHYRSPEAPSRTGNRHSGLAVCPYNVYETTDGHVAIICVTEHHWDRLTRVMGLDHLADEPDFATNLKRRTRMDTVDEIVGEWTRERTRGEITDLLLDAGVPVGPVKERDEVLFDSHLEGRNMIHEVEHPEHGTVRVPGSPIVLHGADEPTVSRAHAEGEANEEVYGALGYTAEELDELRRQDVI